ncbi:MAG: 2-phosphosulfolactate phosphatase [Bacteroidales bacterium]|nr:2-phosphosulfolactate phosphatase [Bacteroidales bacterium]
MNIEVILSPLLYDMRTIKQSHTTVAVDVLRATSAICAAFQAGAEEIVPLDSLEPLRSYADMGYLIAAERGGCKLAGATCGNSPTEYLTMDLKGQRLAYSTTNGTVSILRASGSDRALVGAFANISVLAEAINGDENLVILCSGWKGEPSLEDTVFAGALVARLQQIATDVVLVNDAAMMSRDLWTMAEGDPLAFCSRATHVHRLESFGDAAIADIRWAFQLDTCPLLPVLIEGKLVRF